MQYEHYLYMNSLSTMAERKQKNLDCTLGPDLIPNCRLYAYQSYHDI